MYIPGMDNADLIVGGVSSTILIYRSIKEVITNLQINIRYNTETETYHVTISAKLIAAIEYEFDLRWWHLSRKKKETALEDVVQKYIQDVDPHGIVTFTPAYYRLAEVLNQMDQLSVRADQAEADNDANELMLIRDEVTALEEEVHSILSYELDSQINDKINDTAKIIMDFMDHEVREIDQSEEEYE